MLHRNTTKSNNLTFINDCSGMLVQDPSKVNDVKLHDMSLLWLQTYRNCQTCNGGNALRCTMCRGTGKVIYQVKNYTLRRYVKKIFYTFLISFYNLDLIMLKTFFWVKKQQLKLLQMPLLKIEQSLFIFQPPWILMFHCHQKTVIPVMDL